MNRRRFFSVIGGAITVAAIQLELCQPLLIKVTLYQIEETVQWFISAHVAELARRQRQRLIT